MEILQQIHKLRKEEVFSEELNLIVQILQNNAPRKIPSKIFGPTFVKLKSEHFRSENLFHLN